MYIFVHVEWEINLSLLSFLFCKLAISLCILTKVDSEIKGRYKRIMFFFTSLQTSACIYLLNWGFVQIYRPLKTAVNAHEDPNVSTGVLQRKTQFAELMATLTWIVVCCAYKRVVLVWRRLACRMWAPAVTSVPYVNLVQWIAKVLPKMVLSVPPMAMYTIRHARWNCWHAAKG